MDTTIPMHGCCHERAVCYETGLFSSVDMRLWSPLDCPTSRLTQETRHIPGIVSPEQVHAKAWGRTVFEDPTMLEKEPYVTSEQEQNGSDC